MYTYVYKLHSDTAQTSDVWQHVKEEESHMVFSPSHSSTMYQHWKLNGSYIRTYVINTSCLTYILWVQPHMMTGYIHNSLNPSLPFAVCIALTFFLCRMSAPKVSHSSCTRSSWPYRAASRTAVQPSWRRGCNSELWYNSTHEAKDYPTSAFNIDNKLHLCGCFSFNMKKLIHYFSTSCGFLLFKHW